MCDDRGITIVMGLVLAMPDGKARHYRRGQAHILAWFRYHAGTVVWRGCYQTHSLASGHLHSGFRLASCHRADATLVIWFNG